MYNLDFNFWWYFAVCSVDEKLRLLSEEERLYPILGIGTVFVLVWLIILLKYIFKKCEKRNTKHGSAEWGTVKDARKAFGGNKKDNLIVYNIKNTAKTLVGYMLNGTKKVYIGIKYHCLIIAKTRGGKGTGFVIPNLLYYTGSIICNDIKGENFITTHEKRRSMGQEIYKFDPYNYIENFPSQRFNCFDYLEESDPECITLATDLADMIGGTVPPSSDPFFSDYGKKILLIWILYICVKYEGKERSLATLRKLTTLEISLMRKIFESILEEEENHFKGKLKENVSSVLAIMGEEGKESKLFTSVYSTADTMTKFLNDPRICEALSESDIDVATFKYIPSTLYIIVEANNIAVSQLLLKIIYTYCIKKTMTIKIPESMKKLGLKKLEYPVKMFMDEFAQLETFNVVKKAMSFSAGLGLMFCIIIQNISQLEEYYGAAGAKEFLSNATRIFVGAEILETAKVISESCGKTTVQDSSYTIKPGLIFDTKIRTYSNITRDLITPDEVLRMPTLRPILLAGEVNPLKLYRFSHFSDEEFKGQYKNFDTH